MSEAAEADYCDANDFAEDAEEYADKAIKLSQRSASRGGAMSERKSCTMRGRSPIASMLRSSRL